MSRPVEQATQWVYEGVWAVLSGWFRVPQAPPTLPALDGAAIESFRPSIGWLRYTKFKFWIALAVIDLAILVGWLALVFAAPIIGVLLAPLAFLVAVVPDVVAYVAIHLHYDTTWYVMNRRSIRIRRGIWVIRETTITFENIQNVSVAQGPVERWFGIANVTIQTAGGGSAPGKQAGAALLNSHQGVIEGVADAPRIRDLILNRVRQSRSAGLGDQEVDEPVAARPPRIAWTAEHVAALRSVRDAARELAAAG